MKVEIEVQAALIFPVTIEKDYRESLRYIGQSIEHQLCFFFSFPGANRNFLSPQLKYNYSDNAEARQRDNAKIDLIVFRVR